MVVRVDPEDLRGAAGDISEAARLVGDAFAGRAADLSVADQAGWSTVRELATAVGAWGPYVGGLRDAIESSATALRAAGADYVVSDWQAEQRMRRLGGTID